MEKGDRKVMIYSINKNRIKKFTVMIIIFIVGLFVVFISDDFQQENFSDLRKGYAAKEEGLYAEAKSLFEQYLSAHKSPVYWSISDIVNKNSLYEKAVVEQALSECNEAIS